MHRFRTERNHMRLRQTKQRGKKTDKSRLPICRGRSLLATDRPRADTNGPLRGPLGALLPDLLVNLRTSTDRGLPLIANNSAGANPSHLPTNAPRVITRRLLHCQWRASRSCRVLTPRPAFANQAKVAAAYQTNTRKWVCIISQHAVRRHERIEPISFRPRPEARSYLRATVVRAQPFAL